MKKSSISIVPLFLLLLMVLSSLSHAQKQFEIHVSAGAFDRSEAIVSFYFPEDVEQGVYSLKNSSGETIPIQVDNSNRGLFILDELSADESRQYRFTGNPISVEHTVSKKIDETTISFQSGGRDVLSYFHGNNNPPEELDDRYKRGGYIHPVYSPDGVLLTAHLNVLHPHHSGIWSAWTNTEFQGRTPDFWNIHLNSGRVDQTDSLKASWQGPVHGGFKAGHYFTDLSAPAPVIALNEEWEVHIYKSPENRTYHIFDLMVTQTVNTGRPLILPEYRYGGVGFRGHKDWDDPENMTFMTAEGLGRDGHGTRTRWTHIGGLSDGELAGITVMSHPKNYRHPQTVRIHPDEPFFNYAPTQLGEMSIEPGSPYVARYRFVTYDGEPDPEELDRLWNDYAYPTGVTVSAR